MSKDKIKYNYNRTVSNVKQTVNIITGIPQRILSFAIRLLPLAVIVFIYIDNATDAYGDFIVNPIVVFGNIKDNLSSVPIVVLIIVIILGIGFWLAACDAVDGLGIGTHFLGTKNDIEADNAKRKIRMNEEYELLRFKTIDEFERSTNYIRHKFQ